MRMRSRLVVVSLFFVICVSILLGQTKFEFEVASIKPAKEFTPNTELGLHVDGAQISATYISLKELIVRAYRLKDYQISGPDWLASERFDIAAKIPAGARPANVPEMLQTLLQERFRLQTHLVKKEIPVYSLEIAKTGLKVKESDSEPQSEPGEPVGRISDAGMFFTFSEGSTFLFGTDRIEIKKLSMETFTRSLSSLLDRPVVDATRLKGRYEFALNLSKDDVQAMRVWVSVAGGREVPPKLLTAIQGYFPDSLSRSLEKLGLKLQPGKAPIDVLVIDSAQKKPTEN